LKFRKEYVNPITTVVFIGYDNKKNKKIKQNEILPVGTPVNPGNTGNYNTLPLNNESKSPFDGTALLMLSLVFSLSLLAGFVAWKFKQPKHKVALLSGN